MFEVANLIFIIANVAELMSFFLMLNHEYILYFLKFSFLELRRRA